MLDNQLKRDAVNGVPSTINGNEKTKLYENNNIKSDISHPWIYAFLKNGRENARSADELMEATGLSSKRYIQRVISQERKLGHLILSDSSGRGYYLPAEGEQGRAEMETFLHRYKAQSVNTLKTLKAFEHALQANPEQYVIPEMQNGKEQKSK